MITNLLKPNRDTSFEGELEGVGEKIKYDLFPHLQIDVHRLGQRVARHHQVPTAPLSHGGAENSGEVGFE